jgi:hypothetical protein
MKKVTTLTVRQDLQEPRLKVKIYQSDANFYIRIESDHPTIPTSMPMRIQVTNFKDAKGEAVKMLRLIRGVFRGCLGKAPDLPECTNEMEPEVPAFLEFLPSNSFWGQN